MGIGFTGSLSPAMIQENLLRGDDPDHFVEGTLTAPIEPDVHAQKSEAIVRLPLAQRAGPRLSVGLFYRSHWPNGGADDRPIGPKLRSMTGTVPAFSMIGLERVPPECVLDGSGGDAPGNGIVAVFGALDRFCRRSEATDLGVTSPGSR